MTQTHTILIVEHDHGIRELLIDVLTDQGYRTSVAPTGRSGLAAISRDCPDLTLFDTALPDLSAEALIDELRAMRLMSVRVVLMSTRPRNMAPALLVETFAYLEKPFDIETLFTLVAQEMDPVVRACPIGLGEEQERLLPRHSDAPYAQRQAI